MNYDAAFVSFLRPLPTAEQLSASVSDGSTVIELTPTIHFTGSWDTSADANMEIMSAAQEQVGNLYSVDDVVAADNQANQQSPPPLISFRPAEHVLDSPSGSFVLSMDEIPGLISEKPIKCHLFYVGDATIVGWYSSSVVKTKYYLGYFTILPVESAFTNLKAKIESQAKYITDLENEGAGQLDQLSSLGHQFRAADNGLMDTYNENYRLRSALEEAEHKIAEQKHIIGQKISDCKHLIIDNGCLRAEAEDHIKQIIALTAEVNQLKENRARVTYHDNYIIQPEPPKNPKPNVNNASSLNPFGALLASDLQNFNRGQLKSRTESDEREELRQQRRADLAARRELRAFAKLADTKQTHPQTQTDRC